MPTLAIFRVSISNIAKLQTSPMRHVGCPGRTRNPRRYEISILPHTQKDHHRRKCSQSSPTKALGSENEIIFNLLVIIKRAARQITMDAPMSSLSLSRPFSITPKPQINQAFRLASLVRRSELDLHFQGFACPREVRRADGSNVQPQRESGAAVHLCLELRGVAS